MTSIVDLKELTLAELEDLATAWGQTRFRARQILKWVYKGVADFGEMSDISRTFRDDLATRARLSALALTARQVSLDGTQKFRWTLEDGTSIESVLIPEGDHSTLCLSSQVGCALGCRFCLTARQGLTRNLTVAEIINQVLAARPYAAADQPLTNLVFMGMGEALANFAALVKAIGIIQAPWGLNFSTRRVTVSTSGLAPLIPRLGAEVQVNLTVSLNAVDDPTRSLIMPVNRRYPIAELLAACARFSAARPPPHHLCLRASGRRQRQTLHGPETDPPFEGLWGQGQPHPLEPSPRLALCRTGPGPGTGVPGDHPAGPLPGVHPGVPGPGHRRGLWTVGGRLGMRLG